MDHRAETREFLTTRRAKITLERAGLPSYAGSPGCAVRRWPCSLDLTVSLDQVPDGYRAMADRHALKVLIQS